jgi:hypothetical protein
MMKPYAAMLSLAIGTSALATAIGFAAAPPTAAKAPEPQPVYRPVTSDLMNSVIQPRHIKLWLAGKAGNWTYAEYERHNLQGGFARIAAAIPNYKGTAMTDLLDAFIKQPMADLESAIKAKDEAAFDKAYRGLTDSCNSCHQTTGHGMVVLKVPQGTDFPDQEFDAPKP